MKKISIFFIIYYLFFTINSFAASQDSKSSNLKNKNLLKIGVLVPLSGEFKNLGESFLKSIQLALNDISNKNIIIYPKDSKGNAIGAYESAKELEKRGIKVSGKSNRLLKDIYLYSKVSGINIQHEK